jgi:hypothetical protein
VVVASQATLSQVFLNIISFRPIDFVPQSKMAQCMDTHLFCKRCVTSYASAKLGEQNADLCCMDISGCKMPFPDSELRRVLPEKLFELYEQIRQRRDIELAELEGLEECPFCDYKVVMDVDIQIERVLRCQNEVCGKVSCRRCKKEVGTCTQFISPFCNRLLSMIRIIYPNLVKVCVPSVALQSPVLILTANRGRGRQIPGWKACN